MNFSIAKDLFENGTEANIKALDFILLLAEGRHTLLFFDKKVIDALQNSAWFEGLRGTLQDELKLQIKATAYKTKKQLKFFISNTERSKQHFSTEETIRFFIQPVSIILENSLNDQYFLQAIITHFDASGKIQQHLDKGWLQFENAGGCDNVINFIEGKLQSFNYLADKYNKETYQYLRLFILLDSDKTFPTQDYKESYKKLQDYLLPKGIQPFILQKRAMENYMPDEVIEYLTNIKQAWRDAYLHLTDEQKDYLSFEMGFAQQKDGKPILRTELPKEVQELYKDVLDKNYEILKNGCGLGSNFKSDFPKNFSYQHYYESQEEKREPTEREIEAERRKALREGRKPNNETTKTHIKIIDTQEHQVYKQSLINRAQSTGADELEEIINKILALL